MLRKSKTHITNTCDAFFPQLFSPIRQRDGPGNEGKCPPESLLQKIKIQIFAIHLYS